MMDELAQIDYLIATRFMGWFQIMDGVFWFRKVREMTSCTYLLVAGHSFVKEDDSPIWSPTRDCLHLKLVKDEMARRKWDWSVGYDGDEDEYAADILAPGKAAQDWGRKSEEETVCRAVLKMLGVEWETAEGAKGAKK